MTNWSAPFRKSTAHRPEKAQEQVDSFILSIKDRLGN
jgi:hypothetical protein